MGSEELKQMSPDAGHTVCGFGVGEEEVEGEEEEAQVLTKSNISGAQF